MISNCKRGVWNLMFSILAFPKARNGAGMKVKPDKGTAILFYNLLEDGNGDDLALHAALPVVEGEKWLANFWVWDAKRKG